MNASSATPTPVFEIQLMRLTFAGIILASFFAALTAGHELRTVLNPTGTALATDVLGLSAAFAFIYVLGAASSIKFEGAGYVDRFPLSEKVTHFFYDASINIFGIFFLALAVEWTDAHLLHLPNTILVWPLYLVLFSVIYVVARLLWAVVQLAIEAYYDFSTKREERLRGRDHRRNDQ